MTVEGGEGGQLKEEDRISNHFCGIVCGGEFFNAICKAREE